MASERSQRPVSASSRLSGVAWRLAIKGAGHPLASIFVSSLGDTERTPPTVSDRQSQGTSVRSNYT